MRQALKSSLTEAQQKQAGDIDKIIDAELKKVESPWFRFFLTFDPRPTLAKVHCPVLALNGEKDLQVPPKENLAEIEKALKQAGNTRGDDQGASRVEPPVPDVQDRVGRRVRRDRRDNRPLGPESDRRLGRRSGEMNRCVLSVVGCQRAVGAHNLGVLMVPKGRLLRRFAIPISRWRLERGRPRLRASCSGMRRTPPRTSFSTTLALAPSATRI